MNEQEALVASMFICDVADCQKYLQDPVTLSCGDTLCKYHIDETGLTFICPICHDQLEMLEPFQVNIKMGFFLNKNLHLTGQHKLVKELLDRLDKEIDDFPGDVLEKQEFYINDYLSCLQRKNAQRRDEQIQNVCTVFLEELEQEEKRIQTEWDKFESEKCSVYSSLNSTFIIMITNHYLI